MTLRLFTLSRPNLFQLCVRRSLRANPVRRFSTQSLLTNKDDWPEERTFNAIREARLRVHESGNIRDGPDSKFIGQAERYEPGQTTQKSSSNEQSRNVNSKPSITQKENRTARRKRLRIKNVATHASSSDTALGANVEDAIDSFTIMAEDGRRLMFDDIQGMISRLSRPRHATGHSTTVLIFTTPQQRHLIAAENNLIAQIIRQMGQASPFSEDQDIEVIIGIVDCVGTRQFERPRAKQASRGLKDTVLSGEGVAVQIVHDALVNVNSSRDTPQTARGHVTFGAISTPKPYTEEAPFISNPETSRLITFALAETAMLNGNDFTLRRQLWSVKCEAEDVRMLSDHPIDSVSIVKPAHSRVRSRVRLRNPGFYFRPLTPPRRISSSFGNVIRSLEKNRDGSSDIPASQELEKIIPEARIQLQDPDDGIEIWAAVKSDPNSSPWPESVVSYFAMVEDLVGRGFSLFRVQGGGGGWEGKGGPVTLEVDSLENQSDGVSSEIGLGEEYEDAIERYLSGASSPFKPGDVVQFFLAGHPRDLPKLIWTKAKKRAKLLSSQFHTTIGTLSSDAASNNLPLPVPILQNVGFYLLTKRASISVYAHSAEEGLDHGATKLGRLYHSDLPPATSFMIPYEPNGKF